MDGNQEKPRERGRRTGKMNRQRKVRTFGQKFSYTFGIHNQTRKLMTFGNQEIPQYTRTEDQFYYEARQALDQVQNSHRQYLKHLEHARESTQQSIIFKQ